MKVVLGTGVTRFEGWISTNKDELNLLKRSDFEKIFCNQKASAMLAEHVWEQATWAIFEANGELPDATQKIYKQFYTEWLPNSGYSLADLPAIECYMQENRQEVWIAIIKK